MIPFSRCSKLFKPFPQSLPHVNDPVCHHFNAVLPFLEQLCILENQIYNPATVSRRVGVHCSNNQGHLGLEAWNLVLVLQNNCQISSSLIVQAKVLGKGLGTEQFKASFNKVTHRPGVSIKTSRGKSLHKILL